MNDLMFYRELEEMANIGWWYFDIIGNKLVWSNQTYKIHKIKIGDEIEVESAINFYVPSDRPVIETAFKNCLENHESFNLRLRIIDSEGTVKWVRSHGKCLIENGNAVRVFGTLQDIDEQTKTQDARITLSNELQRYKNILDEFAIVGETDLRGTITYANKKFCESSGYKKEELIGQNHRILNSGYHGSEFFKTMWESITKGIPWSGQVCNMKKDKTLYWVETYIAPTYDQGHNISGYISLRFNITERVLLQKQITKEQERASFSAQLASVGEMSANIAHEIANPITIIYGRNNILMKCLNDEEKLLNSQRSISGALERIQKIIKGLKRLSRKSLNDEFEIVSLKTLVDETLDFLKESLRSNQIELDFDEIAEDIFIECREIEISQVLLNLINNARDAILEGSTNDKWIKVDFSDEGEVVKFKISDSGPGIPEEHRDQIMNSFYTTKKVGKGTGLGLSLASRFLNEHGGLIKLEDECKNTTFTIVLPKLQANKETA